MGSFFLGYGWYLALGAAPLGLVGIGGLLYLPAAVVMIREAFAGLSRNDTG